jgi:hypothetical protein
MGRTERAASQIAQMFADARVDRYTPCKLATGGDWRTIDDYLPTLKYGTQLPAATPLVAPPPMILSTSAPGPSRPKADNTVAIVDLDLPFLLILKLMFKWAAALLIVALCFMPIVMILWLVFVASILSFIGGLSGHHP